MVGLADLPGVSRGAETDGRGSRPERKIGRVTCRSSETQVSLYTDLVAVQHRVIHILSVIGAESAVKAAHAMLASDNGWATFQFDAEASGMYRWNDHTRAPQGYTTYRARASLNNWHFLFVAKTPGLLLSMDEASVWRELRSERYTTPILREWVMYLIRKLKDDHCLETLGGFGHNAGLLTADSDDLDKIVKNGLRHRKLRIQ